MQKQIIPMPAVLPAKSPNLGATDRYTISTSPEKANNCSPGLQTVLDQPPAAFPRQMLLGGMVFCLAFVAWTWLGKIDEVGHANGQLVPKGEVYKIHPVELGKVVQLSVKEGEVVKAGQVLVQLDSEIATNEVERLQQMLGAYQVELSQKQGLVDKTRLEAANRAAFAAANLQAQREAITAAKAKVATTRGLLSELQVQIAASQTRRQRLQPLTATIQEQQTEMRADVAAHQARIKRLNSLVEQGAIAKEHMFEAEQALRDRTGAITRSELAEGATTNDRLFEAEQALRDRTAAMIQNQGELQQALAEVERLQAGLAQKQAEARTTQLETQQQIQQLEVEITELKAKMTETRTLLNSARAKLVQRFLYAPIDGVVSSLNIRNIGEVVQPGQTIAEMAPQTAPLILLTKLPNQEAGFVKIGMPVQTKLDAYPYQDYGIVTGKVTSVSPDAKPDERLGPVYRVEVELDRNYVNANHQTIPFKAGQTASADIIIRRRHIIDILLDPIRKLQKGGMDL